MYTPVSDNIISLIYVPSKFIFTYYCLFAFKLCSVCMWINYSDDVKIVIYLCISLYYTSTAIKSNVMRLEGTAWMGEWKSKYIYKVLQNTSRKMKI